MAKDFFRVSAMAVINGKRHFIDKALPGGQSYELEIEGVAHWHSDPSILTSDQPMAEVFTAKAFIDVDESGKIKMNGGLTVVKTGLKTRFQNFSRSHFARDHYDVTVKSKFSGGKTASLVVTYEAKTRKHRNHVPYKNSDSISFKGLPAAGGDGDKKKEEEKKKEKPRKVRMLNIDAGTFPYGVSKFDAKVKGKGANHFGYAEFKKSILAGSEELRLAMRTGELPAKHKIIITGYADYTGPEPENDKLAKRRAEAVKKVMMDILGVPGDRFAGVAGRQITKKKAVKGDPGNPASRFVNVKMPWQFS